MYQIFEDCLLGYMMCFQLQRGNGGETVAFRMIRKCKYFHNNLDQKILTCAPPLILSHLGHWYMRSISIIKHSASFLKIIFMSFPVLFPQFAIKIDQAEDFLQNPHEFESAEALQSLLLLHDRHAKGKKYGFPLRLSSCRFPKMLIYDSYEWRYLGFSYCHTFVCSKKG